ncbi:MAG: biotin transporter BioY [Clostridium sp.]|nr:biotin transporter BioY [Clostridium sp.]
MKNNHLKDMVYAAVFTAVMAILGWISITLPLLPAPITGQTFGVMLAGVILSKRQAALSMLTFILLGAIGVPVFSNGGGGLAYLAGPTGGFILGFLGGALIISAIRGDGKSILRSSLSCIIGGILFVYIIGIPWLSFERTGHFFSLPIIISNLFFIPGDLIKAWVAGVVGVKVRNHLRHLS